MKINPIKPNEKHYTATVCIVTQEEPKKVLLVHHKKFNAWMMPGGHQEPFENPYEAAIREVKEETGIDITKYIKAPENFDDHANTLQVPQYLLEEKIPPFGDQPFHYHLDQIYIVSIPYQQAHHQEKESFTIGWFSQEEIQKLTIIENVRNILDTVFNK